MHLPRSVQRPIARSALSPLISISGGQARRDRRISTSVASEAVIEALIARRYPHLSQAICRRIADFSGGSSRIASLAAQQIGPNANIADLGDEKLFEKLFYQNSR